MNCYTVRQDEEGLARKQEGDSMRTKRFDTLTLRETLPFWKHENI